MPRGLIFPLFGAILLLSAGVVAMTIAAEARTRPLDGLWRAAFAVDSSTRPQVSAGRQAEGRLTLEAGALARHWASAFWQQTFVGQFEIPFGPALGVKLPGASPPALAVRRGRDSVTLFLGQPCCDAGGLRGLGIIHGDTIMGAWDLDLDGELVRGSFRLERVALQVPDRGV